MGLYLGNIEIPQVNYTTIVRDATAANYQAKTVTPTKATQTVTPSNGYIALSQVTVNPIPSNYISPTGNLSITGNGTGIDVSGYATVSVNVPTGSGGITPSGTYTINSSGSHNVTNYATATVPYSDCNMVVPQSSFITQNNIRKWQIISAAYCEEAGWINSGEIDNMTQTFNAVASNTTITPSTASQTIGGANYMMEGPVTVAGDSDLVAGNIKSGVNIFGVTGTYSGSSSSPRLQAKTGINPSTSSQTIQPDSGYDGLSSVQINAMTTMTLPTSPEYAGTGTSIGNNITRSTSTRYLNIPVGYNSTARYYTISGVANGTVTAPSTITGTSSSVSRSGTTLTLTKTVSVTPNVTAAGYISSGTAGNSSISLSVTDANFIASNIKSGVTIFGLTGTYEGSGGGTTPTGVSIGTKTVTPASTSSVSFTGLSGQPTAFIITYTGTLAEGNKISTIMYDGTKIDGQYMTTTSNWGSTTKNITYNSDSFTYTYSNGTLQINSSNSNIQFVTTTSYKLVYIYGNSSSDIYTADVAAASGQYQVTYTNITQAPRYWFCMIKGGFDQNYTRTQNVVYDGTSTYGCQMSSTGSTVSTNFEGVYSNGSFVVRDKTNSAYFHNNNPAMYYELVWVY